MKTLSLLLAFIASAFLLGACTPTTDEQEDTNVDVTIEETMDDEDMDMDDADMDDESMDMEVDMEAVVFDVSGTNFAFSETELTVKKGDTITINFISEGGFHDWVVDEFDAATAKVNPEDGVTSVTFVADEAGEFEYYCSVGQHRANGMVGTLIVTE